MGAAIPNLARHGAVTVLPCDMNVALRDATFMSLVVNPLLDDHLVHIWNYCGGCSAKFCVAAEVTVTPAIACAADSLNLGLVSPDSCAASLGYRPDY